MTDAEQIAHLVDEIIDAGVRRVHVLAWRDLDDPDAGGSEVHADHFMTRWADAGLDVLHRTSAGVGIPAEADRGGYRIVRRGSRYSVFPRTVVSEVTRSMGPYDGLVEIWNGVPWLSPVWCRKPSITVVHHVHGPMWDQIMPRPLAGVGRVMETRLAPPFYRRGQVVTPSESTRGELIELGFRPDRVTAFPNGVDEFFTEGLDRYVEPTIVAAARLAPVKRFISLLDAAEQARQRVPNMQVRIVGEGPERANIEAWVREHAAQSWVTLVGHITRIELRDEYRRAWLVVSASLAEGWGLALTEAAACGTAAVATDINGHRSSVVDGVTGLLAPLDRLGERIADVLTDDSLRTRLAVAALDRARTLTWDASALGLTSIFHRVVQESR